MTASAVSTQSGNEKIPKVACEADRCTGVVGLCSIDDQPLEENVIIIKQRRITHNPRANREDRLQRSNQARTAEPYQVWSTDATKAELRLMNHEPRVEEQRYLYKTRSCLSSSFPHVLSCTSLTSDLLARKCGGIYWFPGSLRPLMSGAQLRNVCPFCGCHKQRARMVFLFFNHNVSQFLLTRYIYQMMLTRSVYVDRVHY